MVLCGKEVNRYRSIRRITIDLDTRDIDAIINCLQTLKKYGFTKNLEIKLSPSGKGYHIIAWTAKGVSLEKLVKIRREAGDDPIRCDLDLMGDRAIQVLFTNKVKRILKNGGV